MRILICEDEIDLADGLSTILKGNKYSVDVVYDGEEALNYLEAENYDAVILDIMMPKVDGITVLKTIRENGNSIPVIMLQQNHSLMIRLLDLIVELMIILLSHLKLRNFLQDLER